MSASLFLKLPFSTIPSTKAFPKVANVLKYCMLFANYAPREI